MNTEKKSKFWQIDFKHGTYRVMNGEDELNRFQSLREAREFMVQENPLPWEKPVSGMGYDR